LLSAYTSIKETGRARASHTWRVCLPASLRFTYQKNINKTRAASVADAVIYAAEKGKLQGGYGAPGGKGEYKKFSDNVLRAFHEKGYKVYETEIMLGTGGKANNKHVVHAVDLGKGKTFVSSDFSLNRFGYGAKVNNNPYKAYQAGRKLVETEKRNPGSAKVWEPKGAKPAKAKVPKGSTTKPKAQAAPKKEEPKRKPVGMANWSKGRLERAMEKARDDGDQAKMQQIASILGGMS